tara:strand:+ start:615 stop:854 length:240 start_codon:yes stop_codon:yes gene_type:complete
MAGKKKSKYDDPELKKNCIPKDNKTREQMIELFVIENINNPEKFEYGPIVNKNNDPIYIPDDLEEEVLYLDIPSSKAEA